MQTNDTDKLTEALVLLEFTQDMCAAWNTDAIQFDDTALTGLIFLLRQIEEMVELACGLKK